MIYVMLDQIKDAQQKRTEEYEKRTEPQVDFEKSPGHMVNELASIGLDSGTKANYEKFGKPGMERYFFPMSQSSKGAQYDVRRNPCR